MLPDYIQNIAVGGYEQKGAAEQAVKAEPILPVEVYTLRPVVLLKNQQKAFQNKETGDNLKKKKPRDG